MTTSPTRRWLQALLLIAILAAAVRLVFIVRERNQPAVGAPAPSRTASLNREVYVVPKKLHPFDLKSARQLTQQPVWIKEGYRYTYFPYDPARRRADFQHQAGLLGPIERLRITDVLTQPTPGAGAPSKPGGGPPKPGGARPERGRRGLGGDSHGQVLAVFEKDGRPFAVPVGTHAGSDFQFYADEMFFYEDPRRLYDFWPSQVWQDIAAHRLRPGMDELQAAFAVGMGVPQPVINPEHKVVQYPNGGHPLTATYVDGKVVAVK